MPGASVARVARRHDVNANQVFYWRKLYREGRLGISIATPFLPVKVKTERPSKILPEDSPMLSSGTMEIRFSRGTLRIAGSVDVLALRAVLECLIGTVLALMLGMMVGFRTVLLLACGCYILGLLAATRINVSQISEADS